MIDDKSVCGGGLCDVADFPQRHGGCIQAELATVLGASYNRCCIGRGKGTVQHQDRVFPLCAPSPRRWNQADVLCLSPQNLFPSTESSQGVKPAEPDLPSYTAEYDNSMLNPLCNRADGGSMDVCANDLNQHFLGL